MTEKINGHEQIEPETLLAEDVAISPLGSPAVSNLQEYLDSTGSAGWFTGGELSDSGSGEIDIAAGAGFIRATTSPTAELLSFEWSAFTNVAIPSGTTRYVYIDYNAGSPTYELSASEFDEEPDKILIGVAINEAGAIEGVFNVGVRLAESIGNAGRFMRNVLGISRDVRRGGLTFGLSGTRNITLTAGSLWWGRTRYPITALDTSSAGSFPLYYYNGAAWVKVATQTQWPNTQYNDITSGLVTMTNNRWSVLWFYIEPDDHVVMVYGRNQYVTQELAELESPPATLPNRLSATGVLAARFAFQKSASAAVVSSAFETLFTSSAVSDHNSLSSLQGGTTDEYYHLTAAEHAALGGGSGAVPHAPGGRLTLVTGTPVMTTEQAAKTTIYYAPHEGDLVPIYDGAWTEETIVELSLALDADSGHTGYHQSGKNFDLFVYDDGGTLRLVSGPAWTNDTTRATALEYVNGIRMNAASMTARFGSVAGNTVTVARDRGTYVGYFRASANGITTWELGGEAANGDETRLFLYNAYNQVKVDVSVRDSTASWTYNSTIVRSMHASNTNRISFLCEDNDISAALSTTISGGAAGDICIGISLDVTNAFSHSMGYGSFGTYLAPASVTWGGKPGLGFHYLQAVEGQLTTASVAQIFGSIVSEQTMNFTASLLI